MYWWELSCWLWGFGHSERCEAAANLILFIAGWIIKQLLDCFLITLSFFKQESLKEEDESDDDNM